MDVTVREARGAAGLAWAFPPWFLPLWYGAVAYGWWRAAAADLPAAARPGSGAGALMLALALAGKLAGFLVESAFYRYLWLGRGRRLPFWRFFCVVASASTVDLLARLLASQAVRDPALEPWLAPVAGVGLARGTAFHSMPALRAAFGTLGLLTVVRLAVTAEAQRTALGLSFSRAMAWTTACWLVTRVALLFGVDLMSGMSPLGKG